MKAAFVMGITALMLGAAGPEAGSPKAKIETETSATDLAQEAACRERVTQVRAERGLPMLDRRTASSEEPLFIAAIDQRLDECGVLVMRNDLTDIRLPPTLPNSQPLLMPAR